MLSSLPRKNSQTPFTGDQDTPDFTKREHYFKSQGVECEGWLYLPAKQFDTECVPKGKSLPPVVVMAHGMGAQKDMGLSSYAEAFASGGMAAFVFDYRSFGGSEGGPRHWVSPARHLQDWHAAVHYVRTQLRDSVDSSRLCLWGTSFAGGHVLAVAHSTPGITAIISQVPHLDARAATLMSIKKRGVPKALLSLVLGAADALGARLGLPPIYLPLVGPVGSLAFMQLNDFETKEYYSKHPPVYQGGWQNKARAALVWELFVGRYSPIQYVPDIACPIQFVAATEDVLCPVDQVLKAVGLAQQGSLMSRQCTHFELYRGKLFEGLVTAQVAFFRQHTGLAKARAKAAAVAAPAGPENDAEGVNDQGSA